MKPTYITQKTILSRGWNKKMIEQLLSEPISKPNPNYRNAPPMKLWSLDEVQKVECTPLFIQLKEEYEKRRIPARKAVHTKEEKLAKIIDSKIEQIKVKVISMSSLEKKTINHQIMWYQMHGNQLFLDYDSELERWMVNYIRHELTQYDDVLYEISGKVGCHKEYYRYRNAVLFKIGEVYPDLMNECIAQMKNNHD